MATEEKLNRRTLKTRLTIREALLALLKHKELRDITITDIANQAEITRKSFYHSYQNVDEVIEEIENDIIDDFETVIELLHVPADLKNFSRIFQALTNIIETDYNDYNDLLRLGRLEHHSLIQKLKTSLIKEVNQILPETLFKDKSTKETTIIFVVGGLIAIYDNWLSFPNDNRLETLSAQASQVILQGLDGVLTEEL